MPSAGTKSLACVLLAAGLGTRMKSARPKVLHTLFDRPMLAYTIDAVQALKPKKTVVVVGNNKSMFEDMLSVTKGLTFAIQKQQKGTAHALQAGLKALGTSFRGTVLVTTGDTPLLTPATLRNFLALHRKNHRAISVLSFPAEDPTGYGRVVRGAKGEALKIVEEKDATPAEKEIIEVNSGVYAIETSALPYLKQISVNPQKGEYYLTDIVDIAINKNASVGIYCLGEETEFMGVNTREELMVAHKILSLRSVGRLMDSGVTFLDADTVNIAPSVKMGPDTTVYPNVFIHGNTVIGRNCIIYPNARIVDSSVRDGAIIKDGSVVESSTIGKDAQVGPYAHLRPGSVIGEAAKIGNFVETKKSVIGKGSKAMHLSYIGDSSLGKGVNIGAGTITCNYDGTSKHKTSIGDNVFIGSDSQLVAPVKIGKDSYVGAGSTITRNVPPGTLALSRVRQSHIKRKKKK